MKVFDNFVYEVVKGNVIIENGINFDNNKVRRAVGSSKCVTNKIKPVRRLSREDIIRILNGGDV